MADIFSVIADPTRRQLLSLLLDRYVSADPVSASGAGEGEYSVSELVAQLELSQPTVSKHLKVLRDAGLVVVREEGQHRYYRIDVSPLEDVEDWLIPFLSADFDTAEEDELWENASDAVKSAAATFGQNVGRRAAQTSHAVKTVADDLVSKLRR
ncbi:metalloregulator ArsR/SmtB family transcription factor [Herbiconiux sp. KACC 21604]|uniref:Metalloregulator ArsR/SmtB family transcription factor n=1 Tax=Herbiconiux sp. A18JL235 TaxID=3152363 RepID=A0AB39BG28_9MICO|nr:metalloregulator ArsR/SmtB family transcription factor [Herbiconiux sp. SALV-R1]QJU52211.1 winged helix-turn-helix transcriptional regulator [Herbiconiux sp. SALV-R1]WPO87055.1 metalloregulator ArsR/SmtB family transcription factor [Herbiconiux sp. KACC 21604]